MDPSVLGSLIGGGVINLIIWGTLLVLVISDKRRKKRGAAPKGRVDPSAWEPMFGRAHGDWYRWFAWRPVRTLDRGVVWLRPVWRRRVYKKEYLPGPSYSYFQNLVELKYIFD